MATHSSETDDTEDLASDNRSAKWMAIVPEIDKIPV